MGYCKHQRRGINVLSQRAEKVMKELGITKIEDLARFSKTEIHRLPNVGKKTINELLGELVKIGKQFAPRPADMQPPTNQKFLVLAHNMEFLEQHGQIGIKQRTFTKLENAMQYAQNQPIGCITRIVLVIDSIGFIKGKAFR